MQYVGMATSFISYIKFKAFDNVFYIGSLRKNIHPLHGCKRYKMNGELVTKFITIYTQAQIFYII